MAEPWTYQAKFCVPEEVVLSNIHKCKKLGWGWCVIENIVRHTAIMLYLDDEPKYTYNWTPKNGVNMAKIVFTEVEGQLVFEDASEMEFIRKECLQSVAKDGVIDLFNKLTTFLFNKYPNHGDDGKVKCYDVSGCNCRDHVEDVLCNILRPENIDLLAENLNHIRPQMKAEAFLYKIALEVALLETVAYILYACIRPKHEVPRRARKAAGKVFQRYYTEDCLCQGIKLFDPHLNTMEEWVFVIKQALKDSLRAKLNRLTKDEKVINYVNSTDDLECQSKCLELFGVNEELIQMGYVAANYAVSPMELKYATRPQSDPEWVFKLRQDFHRLFQIDDEEEDKDVNGFISRFIHNNPPWDRNLKPNAKTLTLTESGVRSFPVRRSKPKLLEGRSTSHTSNFKYHKSQRSPIDRRTDSHDPPSNRSRAVSSRTYFASRVTRSGARYASAKGRGKDSHEQPLARDRVRSPDEQPTTAQPKAPIHMRASANERRTREQPQRNNRDTPPKKSESRQNENARKLLARMNEE